VKPARQEALAPVIVVQAQVCGSGADPDPPAAVVALRGPARPVKLPAADAALLIITPGNSVGGARLTSYQLLPRELVHECIADSISGGRSVRSDTVLMGDCAALP
jgi:hypothetical protein